MKRLATIGVYGWDRRRFISALQARDVSLLLDIRQRRGVRGPGYAWANSLRLQDALAEAGIEYEHCPELAPTTALRHLQYAEDDRLGVGKRSRLELAQGYRDGYLSEVLDRVDLASLVDRLPEDGTAALFCVERYAQACHRSLVAARLQADFGLEVTYI